MSKNCINKKKNDVIMKKMYINITIYLTLSALKPSFFDDNED